MAFVMVIGISWNDEQDTAINEHPVIFTRLNVSLDRIDACEVMKMMFVLVVIVVKRYIVSKIQDR